MKSLLWCLQSRHLNLLRPFIPLNPALLKSAWSYEKSWFWWINIFHQRSGICNFPAGPKGEHSEKANKQMSKSNNGGGQETSWPPLKSCLRLSLAEEVGLPADKQLWDGYRNRHTLLWELDLTASNCWLLWCWRHVGCLSNARWSSDITNEGSRLLLSAPVLGMTHS